MHSLLTDPLIRFNWFGVGRVEASLPEVYAALMEDEVDAFPALRPHQRHAWHSFLVQLGAMAMHRAGLSEPPGDAGEWCHIIRRLTPDFPGDEPWQLVVEDIMKPAFMQPPVKAKDRMVDYDDPKREAATPDKLDMLVTSKNHDLKSQVAIHSGFDDWAFALVTLQTMEGYGGSHNYGVSRMPSGYGNRPAFSLTPSVRHGAHVKHDLATLVKHRQALLDEYPVNDSGIGLLWTIPWDGTKAEARLISDLDPLYIEICRRVRLRWQSGRLAAKRTNSDSRRIVDARGLTGDPWAPVSTHTNPRGTPAAFLTQRRFGYERVVDGLLSPDWKQPLLLSRPTQSVTEGNMQLVARGMVRGEGGTAGYHERVILLREKATRVFGRPQAAQELGDIAKERIEEIGRVQRILSRAIQVFAARGDRTKIGKDHAILARPWLNQLDDIVDARFFDSLQIEFEAVTSERQGIRNGWLMNGSDGVVDHAIALLGDAADSLPCPAVHRYKARVNAEGSFYGQLHSNNGLPSLDDQRREEMKA